MSKQRWQRDVILCRFFCCVAFTTTLKCVRPANTASLKAYFISLRVALHLCFTSASCDSSCLCVQVAFLTCSQMKCVCSTNKQVHLNQNSIFFKLRLMTFCLLSWPRCTRKLEQTSEEPPRSWWTFEILLKDTSAGWIVPIKVNGGQTLELKNRFPAKLF